MPAAPLNILIEKNSDFAISVTMQGSNGTPIDITGCAIESQLREFPDSPVIKAFNTAILDAEQGKFKISLTAEETEALPDLNMVYDVLFITAGGGSQYRYLQGDVSISSAVTK
jgi:hypothetical protein